MQTFWKSFEITIQMYSSFLEYNSIWIKPMKALDEKYPYKVARPWQQGYGIGLFSKLPIKESSITELTNDQFEVPAIVAQLQLGDQDLRIVGIHTYSPITVSRLKMRNAQLGYISDYVSKTSQPTILMGDFNCTTWSHNLQQLMRKNTAGEISRRGFGLLGSWNAKTWPFQIPIDHAFVSEHIHVHDRSVGNDSAGSDHFPIFTEISITPK